jgi:hypothetical protein
MTKREQQRQIDDLQRRVRELEARPMAWPTIVLVPAAVPVPQPALVPWQPAPPFGQPWITYHDGHVVS